MKNRNGVIFIETRRINGLNEKIQEFTDLTGWPVTVVCSNRNSDLLKKYKRVIIKDINSLTEYNQVMTNFEFWKQFDYRHALVCQADAGMLREGIEEFLIWDYVGAPWPFQQHGGNGGFSLRKLSVIKEISFYSKWNSSLGHEDLFYCNIMHYSNTYRMAPREVCRKFSVESEFVLGTLGYHFGGDSNRFLSYEEKKKIVNQYEKV